MAEKFDIYATITDRMITQLENGAIPWVKPWFGLNSGAFNRVSRKSYSLLNQMLLSHTGEYATFKQWSELGGKIKKGAKSEIVVFWSFVKKKLNENDDEEEELKIPLLKYYRVFHISDVEGVEPLKIPEYIHQPIEKADEVIQSYIERVGIRYFEIQSDNASYSPVTDTVKVPKRSQFKDLGEFYSTVFHELTHSTGHSSRLNRFKPDTHFGDQVYSKEELVAEIGSAAMMNILGIESKNTFDNSARYVNGWLNSLKNDKRLIVSAAGKAEKAVKLMLGEEAEDQKSAIVSSEAKTILLS